MTVQRYNDIVALEYYHRGYADGYRTGFNDSSNFVAAGEFTRSDVYSDDFIRLYREGFRDGYKDGHADGLSVKLVLPDVGF